MPDAAVVAEGLSRSFGGEPAVRGLDFRVDRGELFGLVGPDGAGKSTTLRMLAGVLEPDAGDARVLGSSVRDAPDRVKDAIAYMPQGFGLYEDLTVGENLEFYADLFGVPADQRAERLERLHEFSGLGEFEERRAGALSGGMKQKLALSCALIHDPEVLFLDEPTFGVDPISRRDLWVIVHEMVAEGVTALVSTSYMDEAERFDRLALLHDGEALTVDAPGRLQAGLRDRVLAVAAPDPGAVRRAAEAVPVVEQAVLFGDRVHLLLAEGAEGADRSVAAALDRAGVPFDRIAGAEPTLEDVFLSRTARADAAGGAR